jgi:uncharacterized membrane protein required for colicin V production
MNIADFIVIGVMAVFLVIGSSKGLMLSVFSIASYFLAILIAIKFSPLVAGLLSKTSLMMTIKTKISASMDKILQDVVGDTIEKQIDQITEKLHLASSVQDKIGIEALKETSTTTSGMVESLSGKLTDLILLVIAFVVVYIVAKLVLFLISEVIKKTAKLPVIRSFDKVGGMIFGLLEGVLVIWVLFMILFMFKASDTFKPVFELINRSKIALFMYNNNILLNLVSSYIPKI